MTAHVGAEHVGMSAVAMPAAHLDDLSGLWADEVYAHHCVRVAGHQDLHEAPALIARERVLHWPVSQHASQLPFHSASVIALLFGARWR